MCMITLKVVYGWSEIRALGMRYLGEDDTHERWAQAYERIDRDEYGVITSRVEDIGPLVMLVPKPEQIPAWMFWRRQEMTYAQRMVREFAA